jgi:hypothetical protein
MASYSLSPDLFGMNGTKVFTNLDEKHPDWPWVCFPQPLNPITFKAAKNDPNRQMAFLSLNMWPLSENYKNAIRRSALEQGDNNPRVPTHELCLNFTIETIKQFAKVFPKLVEQVKEANKERDPEIVNQDPTDENTHLFKALRNRLNKRIALVYQPQLQQQPSPYAQPAFAAAGAATGYVAPAEGTDPLAGFSDADVGDLPF